MTQVQKALKDTKLLKSPGARGIYPKFIKCGPEKTINIITVLYGRCLIGEEAPIDFMYINHL